MLKWLLITSITLVSTSMLAFLAAYLAIIEEAEEYYGVDRSKILLFSNSFNILYLVMAPILFPLLKKYYSPLVITSVLLTAVGCVGRYIFSDNYNAALVMSILVAFGHVAIITAPYGIL